LKALIGYLAFGLLAISAVIYALPERYEVRKDYANFEVVEVRDSEGNPVKMTEEELKAQGIAYTVMWVSPKGF
jgi:hypothetical protein